MKKMEEIQEVKIKKNMIMFNLNNNQGYDCEEGVIYITLEDNKNIILDIASGCDITSCNYLYLKDTENTTEEVLFKNVLA